MILLCKKCGYPVNYNGDPASGAARCTSPKCKVACVFYGKDTILSTEQFIKDNCVEFKVEDALDRNGRINELLWWINARKEILGSGLCNGAGGPQLKGVALAIEEVVAVKADEIVKTLVRKTKYV